MLVLQLLLPIYLSSLQNVHLPEILGANFIIMDTFFSVLKMTNDFYTSNMGGVYVCRRNGIVSPIREWQHIYALMAIMTFFVPLGYLLYKEIYTYLYLRIENETFLIHSTIKRRVSRTKMFLKFPLLIFSNKEVESEKILNNIYIFF